jgi:hypothetical protein
MPTHSAFQQQRRASPQAPPRTMLLHPCDFAYSCDRRPSEPVAIGLRHLSEEAEQGSLIEAGKRVRDQWPMEAPIEDRLAAGNEALLCIVVARTICDPNDVTKPHQLFPMAEDTLTSDLTSAALRRIWQERELLEIQDGLAQREATDEDIERLAVELLTRGTELNLLGPARSKLVRRLLAFVQDETAELFVDQDAVA